MADDKYLLVMTACIDPSGGHLPLQRGDPAVRLRDYEDALRYWLRYSDRRINKILFIENSGYALSSLQEIARTENEAEKTVEFVSLDCNWYPPTSHYGYAEMRMLDLGLQQSKLRRATSHMIKVTGRLKFPNLTGLLDRIPENFDVVADARLWRTPFKKHNIPFITTQIILFSHAFFQRHLQNAYHELESSTHWIESFYFIKLFPLIGTEQDKSKVLLRFPCNVDPVGRPAHRVGSYTGPRQLSVNALRSVLRRVAPVWWI